MAKKDGSHTSVQQLIQPADSQKIDLDTWRLRLIEVAHLLSAYFMDVRYWEGVKTEKQTFKAISEALHDLASMPDHDGAILIRFRGNPTGSSLPQDHDYTILFGSILMDNSVAASVVKRLGIRMSHLSGRLAKAFGILAANRISNLYLRIPNNTPAELSRLHEALYIVSRYNQALKTGRPIVLKKGDQEIEVPLVLDETNQPDPNLTLLAGLNRMKPAVVRQMVQHVAALIGGEAQKRSGEQHLSAYNAIWRIKQFKSKLVPLPIEINNVRWMVVGRGQKIVSAEIQNEVSSYSTAFIEPEPIMDAIDENRLLALNGQETKAAQVIAHAMAGDEVAVNQALATVYGDDYDELDAGHFAERLKQATELLYALERHPEGADILDKVIHSIQDRFEDVPDAVFDQLKLESDALHVEKDQTRSFVGKLHQRVVSLVNRFKGRTAVRKKMKAIAARETQFQADEFEKIAEHFNISAIEAEEIVNLLKDCFDNQGHFKRTTFEKHIPAFSRYERKVFELLWSYLKETRARNDRVAFLNSLQLLISEMQQPKRAVKFLVHEFYQNPKRIAYSDRNALMLSTLLIRTYNKELHVDIEITPEEVLFVKNGLDREVVKYARWRIENAASQFMQKMETLRKKILSAVDRDKAESESIPLKFLLSLEREAHIFLSLVGGKTAQRIVRRSVQAYGDPSRGIYRLQGARQQAPLLLQQLKVLVRCLGRVGDASDTAVLQSIKQQYDAFVELGLDVSGFEALVQKVMNWVDATIKRTRTSH